MPDAQTERNFEPITTQEVFDERIKARLAREREKWEKESGVAELRQEIADLKREHRLENARRILLDELTARGVTDEGRQQRIMKLVDLKAIKDGEDPRSHVTSQLDGVASDVPELLQPRVRGAGSRGSSRPVLRAEKPLTRDELENMGEEEINSRWDQVRAFLAGERD
jgi:hypothetical protein